MKRNLSKPSPGCSAPALLSGRWIGVLWLCATGAAACAGSTSEASTASGQHGERRDTRIIHEPCDVSSADAVALDANGDGRPDLTTVSVGGALRCRAVDLNFDGTVDVWVYWDSTGKVRRRETDFDRDGRIDEITLFRAGELLERHRATTLRGELDTWHYFTQGRLTKTLRDSDGDSMIDQWWEYPNPDAQQCPRVHSDADHDGLPDPGSTVDLCPDGVPRAAAVADSVDPLENARAIPVELDQAPATDETPAADGANAEPSGAASEGRE
jgi:hypothetical protein